MAAPILPDELQQEFDDLARKYSLCIHTQQYEPALSFIQDLYNRMLGWQQKHSKRFHKGYPIHNIGYTLYCQNKPEPALKYFILAYIEDLLSADRSEEADMTPAGQTLFQGYRLSPELLELLKRKVSELKKQGRIPLQPEEVIRELEESRKDYRDLRGRITVKQKKPRLRRFTIFRYPWELRVFVGGSIGLDFIIKQIAKMVKKLGYDPIVCTEFEDPEGMSSHDKCLVLLHNCKYAVFDVAEQVGQLMELERVGDYHGVETLVIWPKNKEKAITRMLTSHIDLQKIRHHSYSETGDIEGILQKFLPSIPQKHA